MNRADRREFRKRLEHEGYDELAIEEMLAGDYLTPDQFPKRRREVRRRHTDVAFISPWRKK